MLRGVISQAKSKVGNYGRRVGEVVMLEYSQKMLGTPQLDDHQVAQAVKLGSYFDRYSVPSLNDHTRSSPPPPAVWWRKAATWQELPCWA